MMLKSREIFLKSCIVFALIQTCLGGSYTSEETDEKSKSLYSAVTSILGTQEASKHHEKHTYEGIPTGASCATGQCSSTVHGESSNSGSSAGYNANIAGQPCNSLNGCPLAKVTSHGEPNSQAFGSQASSSAGPCTNSNGCPLPKTSAHGGSSSQYFGAQNPPTAAVPYGNYPSGYYQAPNAYTNYPVAYPGNNPAPFGIYGLDVPGSGAHYSALPSVPSTAAAYPFAAYPHWNSNPYHGYQGERGYSVLDHSLKTNSEYTEVGTHNGPLQRPSDGYGYGSGYGGYMGLYNRPGF